MLCGFESESLCGWTHQYAENRTVGQARLYYHNGDDALTMASSKLRSDHTYGPSKHTGMNFWIFFKLTIRVLNDHNHCQVKKERPIDNAQIAILAIIVTIAYWTSRWTFDFLKLYLWKSLIGHMYFRSHAEYRHKKRLNKPGDEHRASITSLQSSSYRGTVLWTLAHMLRRLW